MHFWIIAKNALEIESYFYRFPIELKRGVGTLQLKPAHSLDGRINGLAVSPFETGERLLIAAQLRERHGKKAIGFGYARFEGEGTLQLNDGLLKFPLFKGTAGA